MNRALLAAAALTLAAPLWAIPKVAVLDATVAQTMDPGLVEPITSRLAESFSASGRYAVIGRARAARVLKDAGPQQPEGIGNAEAIAAGRSLGADFVVVARGQEIDGAYYLRAKLIDLKSGATTHQAATQGQDKPEKLIALAGLVGEALCGGAADRGGQAAAAAAPKSPEPARQPTAEPGRFKWNERPGIPILLNIVPGFGLGSFIQRDKTGGIIGAVGDGVGLVVYYTGFVSYYSSVIGSASGRSDSGTGTGRTLILAGSGIILATTIFGIFRPISQFNRLKEERSGVAFYATPVIAASADEEREVARPGVLFGLSF